MKLQEALAVIGAGVLLFAATDAVTYAATGSSMIVGRLNQASGPTSIQNTGAGAALRLLTKSTATAPLAVNGKGKVVNLYSDRAATADNAARLGGQTVGQVRTGIDAAKLNGLTGAQITSAATSHTSWGTVVSDEAGSSSGDWALTHPTTGTWCITVNGLDLHTLASASVVATPRRDFDKTALGLPGVTTVVEAGAGGDVSCPTGFYIYTANLSQATGALTLADGNGFSFIVTH